MQGQRWLIKGCFVLTLEHCMITLKPTTVSEGVPELSQFFSHLIIIIRLALVAVSLSSDDAACCHVSLSSCAGCFRKWRCQAAHEGYR
jgi:hypothetical protein